MTVYAYELVPRKRNLVTTRHDAYIIQHKGVDSALLALDLNVTERFVISRQRKLGLRKLTGNQPRGKGYGKLAYRPVL